MLRWKWLLHIGKLYSFFTQPSAQWNALRRLLNKCVRQSALKPVILTCLRLALLNNLKNAFYFSSGYALPAIHTVFRHSRWHKNFGWCYVIKQKWNRDACIWYCYRNNGFRLRRYFVYLNFRFDNIALFGNVVCWVSNFHFSISHTCFVRFGPFEKRDILMFLDVSIGCLALYLHLPFNSKSTLILNKEFNFLHRSYFSFACIHIVFITETNYQVSDHRSYCRNIHYFSNSLKSEKIIVNWSSEIFKTLSFQGSLE